MIISFANATWMALNQTLLNQRNGLYKTVPWKLKGYKTVPCY